MLVLYHVCNVSQYSPVVLHLIEGLSIFNRVYVKCYVNLWSTTKNVLWDVEKYICFYLFVSFISKVWEPTTPFQTFCKDEETCVGKWCPFLQYSHGMIQVTFIPWTISYIFWGFVLWVEKNIILYSMNMSQIKNIEFYNIYFY